MPVSKQGRRPWPRMSAGARRGRQVRGELQLLVLLQEILREYGLEEHVVRLQMLDRLLEGTWEFSDAVLLALARAQVVQVLVDGVARIDLPLDPVPAGAQHGRG